MKILFRAEIYVNNKEQSLLDMLTEIDGKYYAIGFESDLDNEYGITDEQGYYWVCKKETRSINMEGMLDSEGNKIFASLSVDGKGGDKCKAKYRGNDVEQVAISHANKSSLTEEFNYGGYICMNDWQVIGIQK